RIGIYFRISRQVLPYRIGRIGYVGTVGGPQITFHGIIISEGRSGSANLSPHVTDGSFSGTGHGFSPFPEILNDSSGSAFYGQDPGHLQNNILGSGPAG